MERIESKKNQLITHVTGLASRRKYRRESGEFVAEGSKLFFDALNSLLDETFRRRTGIEITTVICSESIDPPDIPAGIRGVVVPDRLFEYISTQENSQGIIFMAKIPEYEDFDIGRTIILDGVQDPGNVGTVIRSAAACGLDSVILHGGCADPYSSKTVRATMGAIFRIPVYETEIDEISRLTGGKRVAAAKMDAQKDIREMDWEDCIPVVGNEGAGIGAQMSAICTDAFYIPMRGDVESYNAAIAASIIMWESSRNIQW